MTTVKFDRTFEGETSQAPWRTQPGQCVAAYNLALDVSVGARTRNGTDLARKLSSTLSGYYETDFYFVTFQGDIIIIGPGFILAYDQNFNELSVSDVSDGTYLAFFAKSSLRHTSIRDSVLILNRSVVTASENSPNYSVVATVTEFSDLPTDANTGTYYKVRLADGAIPAGYYKKTATDWEWVAAPNQPGARLTPATMPHQLTKLVDGNYQFGPVTWTDRRSGNNDTNPPMPWVGYAIEDIQFHSGRLFVMGKSAITSTSSRDKELFYVYDIADASDISNPINHDVGNTAVGSVLYSASVGNDLFLACQNGQLVFTSGQEQLTAFNGNDIQIGNFPTAAVPIATTGSSVVMIDGYNSLQEFSYDAQNFGVRYTGNLNSHALKILHGVSPLQVFRFGSITLIPCTAAPIRYHEQTVDGGNLVQTGWGKLDFNASGYSNNQVAFIDEWQDRLRVVLRSDTGWYVLNYRHKIADRTTAYEIAMDFRRSSTGTYMASEDVTRFSDSYATPFTKVLTSGSYPQYLSTVDHTSTYVDVQGNHEGAAILGTPYASYMDLTKFYAGPVTVKPTISALTIYYLETMAFEVLIARDSTLGGFFDPTKYKIYKYKTSKLGASDFLHSGVKTGSQTFNVLLDGRNAFIRIQSTAPSPMTLSAMSFTVRFSDNKGVR